MTPRRIPASGLFLVLLALTAQLAFSAVVPQPEALALSRLATICHTPAPGEAPASPHHHPADCLLCPICTTLTASAPVLATGPILRPPHTVAAGLAAPPPPATAPPSPAPIAAQPRGPPHHLT